MIDNIEPLFSCCMDGCREECSFPADMLAVWGDKLICEDCYDELPYRDKPVDPTDEEDRLAWYELPRFKPPWDARIEALTAENERLKRALYNIQFTATQAFEPEEPPVSQAGSEA